MRTTTKAFKDQVQKHILSGLSTDETEDVKQQLQNTVDGFKNWYTLYEQKITPNRYDAFKEWLLGLPSQMSIEYTYYNIFQTLKTWFENCGAVYEEKDSDVEAPLYYHLVVREFMTLCKKNGVEFL
jgi:hypothetical protein